MPVGQQLPAVPIREPARMTANPAPVRIEVLGTDGAARHGRLVTTHGTVETPVFMPVGTQATVKGLTPDQIAATGARILLANTYHLTLRPGDETVAALGGLHRFMA